MDCHPYISGIFDIYNSHAGSTLRVDAHQIFCNFADFVCRHHDGIPFYYTAAESASLFFRNEVEYTDNYIFVNTSYVTARIYFNSLLFNSSV